MPKVEILLIAPLTDADHVALDRDFTVHRLWPQDDKDAFIASVAQNIRAVVTRGDFGASAKLIASLPKLEIIACFGVGTDAIDLPAARARSIPVTITPDILTDDVADIGMALMLGILRNVVAGDRHVRTLKWPDGPLPLTVGLKGKRLGIYGLGKIGMALATRAAAFGMPIAYHSRKPRRDAAYPFHTSLVELAKASDILAVCASATAETQGTVNAAVLEALGPKGYLINVSRGSVVDEPALLTALEQRTIAGAGLDVFLNEPRIDARFMALDNVMLQPHQGSGTFETRAGMGQLVRDNLAAHFAGKPPLTPVG